jgi:hypothetical protein
LRDERCGAEDMVHNARIVIKEIMRQKITIGWVERR